MRCRLARSVLIVHEMTTDCRFCSLRDGHPPGLFGCRYSHHLNAEALAVSAGAIDTIGVRVPRDFFTELARVEACVVFDCSTATAGIIDTKLKRKPWREHHAK